jgi:hypothetical protein
MLRVAWTRDMSRHLAELPDVTLDPDSDRVLAHHRPAAAGDPTTLYTDAVAALRTIRTRHASGTLAGGPGTPPGSTGGRTEDRQDQWSTRPDQLRGGPVHPGLAGVEIPAALGAHNVIPIRPHPTDTPGPVETPSPTGAHSTEQTSPDRPIPGRRDGTEAEGLNATQACVHDALNSLGWRQLVRTGQLADLTGLRAPAVSKALTVLAERGLAVRLAHGEWQNAARWPLTQPPLPGQTPVAARTESLTRKSDETPRTGLPGPGERTRRSGVRRPG